MAAPIPHDTASVQTYLQNNPGDIVGLFDQAAAGFFAAASPPVLTAGAVIAGGLASIGVVQRGASWALGGRVDATGLMNYVLKVAFVLGLLAFWNNELPGAGASIPQLIAGQGAWLIEILLGTALDDMLSRIGDIWEDFTSAQLSGQAWSLLGGLFTGGAAVALYTIMGPGVIVSLIALAIGTLAAGLAQVVWAGVAISICVMLGPVLVPWLLWKPMEFLFWGWLKTVITYSLYGAIAVAVIRTFMDAMLLQVEAVVNTTGWASGGGQLLASAVTAFLLAITSLMAMIKVPALANGLVSGSGAAGSGIAEAATQATGSSAAATMGSGLQGAGASMGGMGGAQMSPISGQALGAAGSRVASLATGGAAGLAASAGKIMSGMAGQQLPLTKPRQGG